MHLLGWLAGWRTNWASQAFAARRVRRRAGSGIEPLETRLVLASPTVSSIVPDPSQPGANVDNARFVVTFSETVTGVDPADFAAVPGAGVIVAPGPVGVTGSGTTYTVTVNGISGVGTLGLNLVDDNSIRDLGGNRLVGNGDRTFQAAQNFATGSVPLSVTVGDLNGDGLLDLAVANHTGSTVSVLLGNGNGTFQAAQNFATGAGPRSVVVGDLNGDGRLDLAVANYNSDSVSVLLGNGTGTFQAAQNFAVGDRPGAVAVGDLDGDSRLDLAVTNRFGDTVSVLLGNGNGAFQAAQNFATGTRPYSVTIGDMNGDGGLDLAVANTNSDSVSVLLGNGNGTFQAAQNFTTGDRPVSVSRGDVNGDGRLDLAVANNNSGSVSVLLGNGNGTFEAAQDFATGVAPASVEVGDMNGDGQLDLTVANFFSNSVSVLLGNGNGTFQAAQNFATGARPYSVMVGDVQGDGRLDLVVANRDSDTVSVLLNAANGNFAGQTRAVAVTAPSVVSIVPDPSQPGTNVDNPRFVVTFSEDVTGVDAADFAAVPGPGVIVTPGPVVVTGSGTTYTVTVNGVSGVGTLGLNLVDNNSIRDPGGSGLVGNGNGTFQAAQNFATGTNPWSVSVGDLNEDGQLDLAVANFNSATVSVLLGNGNGTFQAAQNFATGTSPFSVAVGDVNGDGRLDLAVSNQTSNTVSVLLGNGNGTFQAAQNFATGTSPFSVSLGDVDGDGRLDLAVANGGSDTVSLLVGNGNGTFQTAQDFATGDFPHSVAVGDVNGDGQLDLAVANFNSNTVSVLLGNGNGTFQTAQNFATGVNPWSVSVGDLNGDGQLDLAVANFNSATVSVLLGNGNGTFQAAQNFATGTSPDSVVVGDLNGDGRLDLVVSNQASNTVSVLLGNGNGTFQTTQNFATGTSPFSGAVGDLNGDGRLDLAVANRNSNTVSVLLNAANGNFTGQTRAVAVTAPSVVSIVPDPSQPGTNVDNPRFVVTFSEAVTGVDPADFVAVLGAGVIVAPGPLVVTGSGATYTVTVNGVSGVGTLGLNLVDNNSIRDPGGNGLVGNGNGTFQAAQNFATGFEPLSVTVGDLNGDGLLDLAVANHGGSSTVSVLLGNGNGTFQAARNFAAGTRPLSVVVGDVNGDGRLDLAVSNQASNTVSVLLGNGTGTFQAAQSHATGSEPRSVAVGDLNGDGSPDLAVANYVSNTVSVLLGNGNGTFQAAQNFATGVQPRSVSVGDVNGDGRLDLAVANAVSNTVSVLLGNGNGTFQATQNFATGVQPRSVSVGDVNGDGLLDLAVANHGSSTVSVLLGNGNGTFQVAQNFATGSLPSSVVVGDLNGDGRLDLAIANLNSDTVSVLLGNGNGTFQAAQNFATGATPRSVAVGDVNGDGRLDLAVANYLSNTVSVLLNAANGDFIGQTKAVAVTAATVVSIVPDPSQPGSNVDGPRFVVTFSEDVTGVDAADFAAVPGPGVIVTPGPVGVTGSGTTYTVTVNGVSGVGALGLNLVDNNSIRDAGGNGLVGNGNGTFQSAQNFATGLNPFSVTVGDLNGDGRLDLAVANFSSNTVSVLLGNGNDTFQSAQNFATGTSPFSVTMGDLNGDSRLDLAVANINGNTVSVLLGSGNGTFQAAQNFATGNGPISVSVGDVNGDGRLDLALADYFSDTVSVLLGNGNGTFQAAQNFATGSQPRSVAVGDVNGDGRLDLAVANNDSDTVSVLLGNGNGTFQAAQNFATGSQPRSVAVGDVNGDGWLDLAVANYGSHSVSVLLGNGNGTFQAALNFTTGGAPFSVVVGDVDGDGRLDLAVANGTVSVLLGNGNGTFQAAQNFATGSSPRSVAVGDVNGDGRLDLAVANFSSSSVTLLLNAANGDFVGQTRSVDTVAPTVTSVLRQDPLAEVTGADQLTFRITFSEAVQNVSIADFLVGGTSAADGSVSSVTPVSTSVYDVLVTGVTTSNGTLELLFAAGQDIADLATNALTNTVPATTETYTLANNRAPTALALGNTTIAENVATGTAIGTFTTTDPDALNTFTYSLVLGTGATDNGSFQIVGNQLQTNAALDFEAKSSYAIRIQTTDQDGLTFEQQFTITVTNVNETPTALALSNVSVAENVATGTAIGTFTSTDPDAGNTFTYSLVLGTGATDNAAFQIVGNELQTNAALDFEAKSSYAIRVQTTDQDGLTFEQQFTITVTNVNETPTAVALSANTVAENVATGTAIGTFTSTDPDAGNTFTYSLVLGTGATDNAAFQIVGNELQTNAALDFEAKSSYAIRVQTTDQDGLTFEQQFTITITNVNETPTAVALSANTVAENVATGTGIGTFTSTDPDTANTFTYSLVLGTGATDNAAFQIVGNELQTNAALDFEAKSSYAIRVQTTDQDGLTFEQQFTITVTNVNEAPTALALSNVSIAESVATGTSIGTFTSTDPDSSNTFTYSLVLGTGSTDNAAFQIVGNELRTNAALDFETKSSYAIRVQTTDQDGLSFEQQFTVTVTNVNEQPTALTLSANTIAENVATGTAIGTFTSTDPDAGNTFTYSLVTGTGSTDNGSFQIVGNELRTNAALDFENKSSYAIRVQTTDQDGLTFEQQFTITVTNVNEAPTALTLSNVSIAENVATGTGIGTFTSTDPDAGNTFTYSLVAGTGSTDNAAFQIVGNELRTNAALDFETKSSYAIRVQTTDQDGLSFEQQFTITVTNVNEAPTALALSANAVAENVATGTDIGTFTSTDPDALNTFTYSLVLGTGSTDNGSFQIVGNELQTNAALDFETKSSYAIRVQTTDQDGLSFEQQFTVTVTNVNEAPTVLALSANTIAENVVTGTGIGSFTTTDPDAGNTFTYSLVLGTGSTDNAVFHIVGNQLQTDAALDFETKSSYVIRVQTTDQDGLSFEQQFTVTVTNVNEQPTALTLSANTIAENVATGTAIGTFTSTDPDAGNTFTYSLVLGTGATDNGSFQIVGNELRTNADLNFEAKSSYSIRIRTTDQDGLSFEQQFTITVTNVNEAPTDIALSTGRVTELLPAGTFVGTLSSTDPDGTETATFAVTSGPFEVRNGNELFTTAPIDVFQNPVVDVTIRATDGGGSSSDATLRLSVDGVARVFRAYNVSIDAHFYTSNRAEYDLAVAAGYRAEANDVTTFSILTDGTAAGSTPLYRLYNLLSGQHYYTIDLGEARSLEAIVPPPASGPDTRPIGWRYEGIVGYMFESPVPGSSEVYRLYNSVTGRHLFTISAAERDAALAIVDSGTQQRPWSLHRSLGYAYLVGFSQGSAANPQNATSSDTSVPTLAATATADSPSTPVRSGSASNDIARLVATPTRPVAAMAGLEASLSAVSSQPSTSFQIGEEEPSTNLDWSDDFFTDPHLVGSCISGL